MQLIFAILGVVVVVSGVCAEGPPGVVVSVELPTLFSTAELREPVEIEKLPASTDAPPEQEYEPEEEIPMWEKPAEVVEEEPEDPPAEPMFGSWYPAILE